MNNKQENDFSAYFLSVTVLREYKMAGQINEHLSKRRARRHDQITRDMNNQMNLNSVNVIQSEKFLNVLLIYANNNSNQRYEFKL